MSVIGRAWDQRVLPWMVEKACRSTTILAERRRWVPQAAGEVLELGVGSGLNLAFYDPARVRAVVAIDPSRALLIKARPRADAAPVPVELIAAAAERLPFAAARFDSAVVTYTLCSVVDPAAALAEVRRVLRPGAPLYFVEHGRSDRPRTRTWQARITPLWRRIGGNCHLDRDIAALLLDAGFAMSTIETGPVPGGGRLTSYTYQGVAVSPSTLRSLCTIATLTLAAAPALADGVQPLGDTVLAPLGRDVVAATSDSHEPAVRHARPSLRLELDLADPELVGPPAIELDTAVSVGATSGTFRLTFNGQTTSGPRFFDGRFLAGRDLTRDQGYRMEAGWSLASAYRYDLFRGGVRVAVADVTDGAAPFVLEGVDQAEAVYTVGTRALPGGGQELEVQSWSFGTWTATFDDGSAFTIDRVVLHVHELGASATLPHVPGATTVRAAGASELRLGLEDVIIADGGPLAIHVDHDGSLDVGGVVVHGVHAPAWKLVLDPRVTEFTPPSGHRIRLRSLRDGAAFGAWSAWSTSAKLVSPAPAAAEAIDDFEVELQRAGSPTIASSGYIRIKKLNSGG